MIDYITQYNKAIVALLSPLLISLVLKIFNLLGIEFTQDIANSITILLTGFFVYLIPNRK